MGIGVSAMPRSLMRSSSHSVALGLTTLVTSAAPDSSTPAVRPSPLVARRSTSVASSSSSRYLFGLLLLGVVVCLWVGSSALIQEIFVGMDFHQPFFLTYYNTSLFTLYLPLFALRQWWTTRSCGSVCGWCRSERSRMRRERVLVSTGAHGDEVSTPSGAGCDSRPATPSTPVLAASSGASYDSHQSLRRIAVQPAEEEEEATVEVDPAQKLGVRDTAKLSLLLCPIWFCMNYFFNLSLNLTSIASSTILSTTSSLFVLLFSYFLDPTTHIRFQHIVGVLITICGVGIISYKDTADKGDEGAGAAGRTTTQHLLGDILATLGAIAYGFYTVLLKLRIPDDSLIEMQLIFGFIGLFNTLLFWPGFFLLAAAGVESLTAPPSQVLLMLTVNGIFGTVISDFLWAKSVLLTSPLIASLGLALTIPLAILVDWLLHDLQFTAVYFIGGICVVFGFILVNIVHSNTLWAEEVAAASHSATGSGAGTPRVSIDAVDLFALQLAEPPESGLHEESLSATEDLQRARLEHDGSDEEALTTTQPTAGEEYQQQLEPMDLQVERIDFHTVDDVADHEDSSDEQSQGRTDAQVPAGYF
jgi:solute carrier family 35 protein F5